MTEEPLPLPGLAHANRIVIEGKLRSWRELAAGGTLLARAIQSVSSPVALVSGSDAEAFTAAALLAAHPFDGLLVPRDRLSEPVRELLASAGHTVLDAGTAQRIGPPPAQAAAPVPGRISLLTSGSTGCPKLVPHRWETLYTGASIRRNQPRRWLNPYSPGTYAWFQIVTLGLFLKGQTIVPADGSVPALWFETALQNGVDSISSTPAFWRVALLTLGGSELARLPLNVLTLGGEPVDQGILDQLRSLYPRAELTHIYASTEAGAAIVVKDGREGFPAAWLEGCHSGSELKVMDGCLWIRSRFSWRAADGSPADWIDTGDLVEQCEDRILFAGRAGSAFVNIGGNKASPSELERLLLTHPAIAWCRVRAIPAPIVGHLLETSLVLSPGTAAPTDAELAQFCRKHVPDFAVPRFWVRLDSIPIESTLKAAL